MLRLCYESEDLVPYTAPQPNSPVGQPGLLLELVEQAARQARLRLDLHRRPWKRCIHEVRQGDSDGLFAAIWQADREAWGRFPGRLAQGMAPVAERQRLWRVTYRIIVRPDSSLEWDGRRFFGIVHGIGAPLGYATSQRLQALGVLASESFAVDKGLRMTAAGRLDGYVLEHEIGQALIERLQLQDRLTLLPMPLMTSDWYLPVSHQYYRDHPELAERFWAALAEQRERLGGELAQRYLTTPTPP